MIDNAELALNKGFADNGTKLDALIRIFSFLDGTIPPRDEIDAALKVFSDQPGFDGFTQLLSVVNAIDPPQSTVLPQIRFDAVMKTLELRNLHLPPPPNPWPSLDELIARADAGVRILREAGFTDAEIEASPRVLDFPSDRLHQVARMVGTLEDAGFVLWDRRGAAFVWLLRQPQGVLDAAEEAMRSGVPPFPTVEAWESPRNWDQFRALMVALIAKFGGIVG